MLRFASRLPDPLVRLLPDPLRGLRLPGHDRPQPPRETLAPAGVQQDRVGPAWQSDRSAYVSMAGNGARQ
jgi:hypothetical protein